MSKRILITGGLGYVGGRIATALAQKSVYNLVLTTRAQSTESPTWLPEAEIVTLDLLSESDCIAACTNTDIVIHLAALNEIDSAQNPEQALLVTALGTLKLLQAAQMSNVAAFIYFSTAHVYGAPLVGTITEETIPRPVHPYAITHKTAEDFVLAAGDCGNLKSLVLRLSNAFGAPTHKNVNRWTLVINDLCRQTVTEGKMTLHSAGLQYRDFITLGDVGRALCHLLEDYKRWGNGIFNLGGEQPLRIIEIAKIVQKRCFSVLGFEPKIYHPEPLKNETYANLDYRIDKLKSTGFHLENHMYSEIDDTLKICQKFLTSDG